MAIVITLLLLLISIILLSVYFSRHLTKINQMLGRPEDITLKKCGIVDSRKALDISIPTRDYILQVSNPEDKSLNLPYMHMLLVHSFYQQYHDKTVHNGVTVNIYYNHLGEDLPYQVSSYRDIANVLNAFFNLNQDYTFYLQNYASFVSQSSKL